MKDPFSQQQDRILTMIRERYPDYHPLMSLAELAHDSWVEPQHRIRAHSIIAEYTERKFATVQTDVNIGVDFGKLTVVYSDHEQELPQIVDERAPRVLEHMSGSEISISEITGPESVEVSGEGIEIVQEPVSVVEELFNEPLETLFVEV